MTKYPGFEGAAGLACSKNKHHQNPSHAQKALFQFDAYLDSPD